MRDERNESNVREQSRDAEIAYPYSVLTGFAGSWRADHQNGSQGVLRFCGTIVNTRTIMRRTRGKAG